VRDGIKAAGLPLEYLPPRVPTLEKPYLAAFLNSATRSITGGIGQRSARPRAWIA
jgi:hypothetical protein